MTTKWKYDSRSEKEIILQVKMTLCQNDIGQLYIYNCLCKVKLYNYTRNSLYEKQAADSPEL